MTTEATIESNGWYVELAPGGPWLAQDYSVTCDFEQRGLWVTREEAQKAIDRSLKKP